MRINPNKQHNMAFGIRVSKKMANEVLEQATKALGKEKAKKVLKTIINSGPKDVSLVKCSYNESKFSSIRTLEMRIRAKEDILFEDRKEEDISFVLNHFKLSDIKKAFDRVGRILKLPIIPY